MEVKVHNKKAFRAIGVKWTGTFEQAAKGEIKIFHKNFLEKKNQIQNSIQRDKVVGLSYHINENGFTYFLVLEVENASSVPEGMEAISVPEFTFASTEYKGTQVHEAYTGLYTWIKENGYSLNQSDLEHLEEYPGSYNPETDVPELKLHIPINL
jgi:predicted transcriptional regulator YdeE